MSKLLRYFAPDQYCFMTSVTADRRPILVEHARLVARAFTRTKLKTDFELIAWVILPDHIHALLRTSNGDTSNIVQRVKLSFSLMMRSTTQTDGPYWQHRYWDHIIRDQKDLNRHIDYIHYNPIKHGLVTRPVDWPLTSFRRYFRDGIYAPDWSADFDMGSGNEYGE